MQKSKHEILANSSNNNIF